MSLIKFVNRMIVNYTDPMICLVLSIPFAAAGVAFLVGGNPVEVAGYAIVALILAGAVAGFIGLVLCMMALAYVILSAF